MVLLCTLKGDIGRSRGTVWQVYLNDTLDKKIVEEALKECLVNGI